MYDKKSFVHLSSCSFGKYINIYCPYDVKIIYNIKNINVVVIYYAKLSLYVLVQQMILMLITLGGTIMLSFSMLN